VAESRVKVRLVGPDEDGGRVHFEDFLHFCRALNLCLRWSEIAVRTRGRLHYRLTDLHNGSAGLEVEPVRNGREAVGFFKKTIAALRDGKAPDHRLTAQGLEEFKKLYDGLRHTREVWIDGAQLTSRYVANIDDFLRPTLTAEGSVTGFLEGLNVHNEKNRFALYPAIGGSVACVFEDDMFEQVRAAVKRNVTVYGTLSYPHDSPHPTKVQAKKLDVHPPDDELPTLGKLRGAFRGCTGGKTAVEFVRAIRDEQD
jgi:hypothetical protein